MASNAKCTFDDVALEPIVEEIRRAAREQIEQHALLVDAALQQAPADAGALEQFEDTAAGIGRRHQHEIAQGVGGALQHRVVGR
jgi:hypothetical protein